MTMPSFEERLAELEAKLPTLKELPLGPLSRWLEKNWEPDASTLLGQAAITAEMLAPPEAWIALPYGAGWADHPGAWQDGQYRKEYGRVWLRGLVSKTGGAPAAGNTIATLPLGYRPATSCMFVVATGEAFAAGRIDITTAGVITWQAGNIGETDYTSLDGVSFYP